MGYRGPDLDLRTSRTFSATSTDVMSGFDGPPPQDAQNHGAGPIWVDDTLLACVNHAFEVALAHRAGEVRIEHLVHALTRDGAAVSELEARGVRTASLRRDSAVLIASEIPVGLNDGDAEPHRAQELEELLRLAAAHAAHAGRPAGVGDVVHAIISQRGDAPGTALLLRHMPRGSRDFWSTAATPRQPRYGAEAHLTGGQEPERPLAAPASSHLARAMRRAEPRRPSEYTILQGMLDRLAEIERAMADRLDALEAAFANAAPASLDLDAVAQRVDALEDDMIARGGDADGALSARIESFERSLAVERAERLAAFSALSADVKALVSALGCAAPDGSNQPSIAERLQLLAADLDQHRVELGASIGDRIAAIEKALEAQADKTAEQLADMNEALAKLNVSHQLLAGSMDQWRSTDAGEIQLINARIGAVQEDGSKRLEMLERLCSDMEALSQLALEDKFDKVEKFTKLGRPAERSFRRWLFGTDDWIKASWPKRSAKG